MISVSIKYFQLKYYIFVRKYDLLIKLIQKQI
jgi:hypothetical protein